MVNVPYVCKYCHGTKPVHGDCTETNALRAEVARLRGALLQQGLEWAGRCSRIEEAAEAGVDRLQAAERVVEAVRQAGRVDPYRNGDRSWGDIIAALRKFDAAGDK